MFDAKLTEMGMELSNYGCEIKFIVTINGIDTIPTKITIQSIHFLHIIENSAIPKIFLSLPHSMGYIECKGLDVIGKCHVSYGEMIMILQALENKCLSVNVDVKSIQTKVE